MRRLQGSVLGLAPEFPPFKEHPVRVSPLMELKQIPSSYVRDPYKGYNPIKSLKSGLQRQFHTISKAEPTEAVGFFSLVWFHQVLFLNYFGYNRDILIKMIISLWSVFFSMVFIGVHIPCLFNCVYDVPTLLTQGLTQDLISFLIVYIEAWYVVAIQIGVFRKGGRMKKLFRRLERFSENYDIGLTRKQRKRLILLVVAIAVLSLVHACVEVTILLIYAPTKIYRRSDRDKGKVYQASEPGADAYTWEYEPWIGCSDGLFRVFATASKFVGSVHGKAFEALIIYVCLILSYQVKQLKHRFQEIQANLDKNPKNVATTKSLEEERFAFNELQRLIGYADLTLSPLSVIGLFVNIVAVLAGILIMADSMVRRKNFGQADYYELFNVISCLFSVYAVCSSSEGLTTESEALVEYIADMNVELIDAANFKSYSILMVQVHGKKLETISAYQYLPLNKRVFFALLLLVVVYCLLMVYRGIDDKVIVILFEQKLVTECQVMNVKTGACSTEAEMKRN